MIDTSNLCMGCMTPREGTGPCPNCGFDETQAQDSAFLPLRSRIADRYLIGRVLSANGEAITYLGCDTQSGAAVQIREYMPAVLCGRRMDGVLVIHAGCETNYKTLMLEYEEILRVLRQQGNLSGVVPVLDICRENNTVYGIFQHMHTMTLGKFLTRCGGELSWSRTKRILLPFLNTLLSLHQAGIIHRGISPETVMIDRSGDLWLTDFSTAALRTNHSEIDPELCSGYAAPEQYNPQSPQGTWTDVYAAAAVMYKMLTGTMPPQSTSRRINDNLCPCVELNPSIPKNVSGAISAAMAVEVRERTQTVDELISGLLQASGGTNVYHTHRETPARQTEKKPAQPSRPPRKKNTNSAIYAVCAMLLTFALLALAFWKLIDPFLTSEESSSSNAQSVTSSQSSGNALAGPAFLMDNNVPSFVGRPLKEVEGNALYAEKYIFTVYEQENDDYAEGIIFDQSPEAGTPMQNRGNVALYVSTGSVLVPMPILAGKTVDEAIQILDSCGIVNYEVIESFEDGEDGVVLRTNIQPDTPIKKNKDKVMLIVKSNDVSSSQSSEESESSESSPEEQSSSSRPGVIVIRPPRASDGE